MNGFILLIPFLCVRFGLLAAINKQAIIRAAHFAPMNGGERLAYWIYQFTTAAILLYPFFLTIQIEKTWWFFSGFICYLLGLTLCVLSVISFSNPSANGICTKGVYYFSRNPMYVAYFLYFIGCALLTASLLLFVIVLVFQISAHWIILSEERWCLQKFGKEYQQYMAQVRRYI